MLQDRRVLVENFVNSSDETQGSGKGLSDGALYSRIGAEAEAHAIMLQQAARLARLGYFVFNTEDNIVEVCSERHAEIFGRTPEDFMRRVTGLTGEMTMMHPEEADAVRAGYDRLRRGETIELEYRFYRKDGSIGFIREFVAPERNAEGRVVRGLGSSLDVTETRLLEEARTHASRLEALGELTAGVAHDFNNLLAVVMGNAELAQELVTDQKVDLHLSEIVSAAERGGSLTRNLLNFAQRAAMAPGPTDLNDEVVRAAETFERTLLKHATIIVRTCVHPLIIHVDKDQLQSMLINLLINARDAVAVGGEIEISTALLSEANCRDLLPEPGTAESGYCVVTVSDRGQGIPAELLSRVTEPFFTTKHRSEGTGLGLSMASGFAQQSNGTLAIHSQEDVGTRVEVVFPLTGAQSNAPGDRTTAKREILQRNVLLLDDDPAVLRSLHRRLETVGMQVTATQTADEALKFIQDNRFDIAILDNIISGPLSGIDVAERIKARDLTTRTILLTGYVDSELVSDPKHIDLVLRKPIRSGELLKVIRDLVEDAV